MLSSGPSESGHSTVLFNTFAYARFFVLVFVATWLLVDRRYAVVLPWLALVWYAVFAAPSVQSLGLSAVLLGVTLLLVRRSAVGRSPGVLATGLAVTLNLGALGALCMIRTGRDPLTLALMALGVPTPGNAAVRFLVFAIALGALFWALRYRRLRLLFLVGASYVFYAHWNWRFLFLIWGSSTVDWLLGRAIGNSQDPHRRRMWLLGTVAVNLGILGFFKYYNFGVDSARWMLAELGVRVPESTLRIALPVGISFFTFESMSYVIDVYRNKIRPHESYLEYLGFVAFFPHLVAGPIIRPRDLLPQLGGPPRFDSKEASDGLYLIATGLLKKVAIGDTLAVQFIDRVFDAPLRYSGLENYLAVVAYALQIYCDFSGYTDIAIGSAQLLGIRFPINFNAPYQATNIADFWHRWHISLSTWLRDYLYVPLGGNRKGPRRTYVNLMLTMLLGGLWHGASWTFVVWGGIHGVALALTRAWERRPRARPPSPPSGWRRALAVFGTFHLVCFGWVFFRSETFAKAGLILKRIASGSLYHPNLHALVVAVMAVGLLTHFIPTQWDLALRRRFADLPVLGQALCLLLAAVVLGQMATTEVVPFVYFQF